ncbi:MAG: NAD(P)H-dependent oxidoreductase [Bacteroidales bacterium]|nr:NAD(P)H-dependent oxidoreductase [Bacteroidales bacterium]MCF8404094.1 NAD(P)H-dependent oxidoreductase [Bacteroidales bacterium]
MRLLILNGNPDESNKVFDNYLSLLKKDLEGKNVHIRIIYLRDLNIIHCQGCWSCWVKTPGKCTFSDDTVAIREAYAKADMVIFASPLIMGFVSSILKKTMDKLIPLVHPYIEIVGDETHHMKRQEKYPLIGLIYENLSRDMEDVHITTDIFGRFAINLKSVLIFSFSISTEISDVTDEIDSY